jgi:hypothetical protein
MHDPLMMLFRVKLIRLDIWHREPGGHDAGEVCGPPPNSGPSAWWWYLRHVRHWHPRWWPVFRVRKWITDRCDHCGRRFRWREARFSYISTDKVWHDPCMALRHVRSQLDDITRYVMATADDTTRWRVEYRLKHLDKAAAEQVTR